MRIISECRLSSPTINIPSSSTSFSSSSSSSGGQMNNWDASTSPTFRRGLRMVTVVVLACLLLLQSFPTTEGMSLSPYNLMGVPPKKPAAVNTKGDQPTLAAVTNSPIYYINKLDLSSLLMNLLPLQTNNNNKKKQKRPSHQGGGDDQRLTLTTTTTTTTTPNPFFEALVASVLANHKKQMTTTTSAPKTTTLKPFKRITLPFISNARPVASYQLKPPNSEEEILQKDETEPTFTVPPPPSSYLKKYTPSKIIRLKTKFVSNGQPSAVYVHKSPARRYFLQDLLRKKPTPQLYHHGNNFRMYKRKNPFGTQ